MPAALVAQIATLLFHQTTTNLDLYPFNNIRGYSRRERAVEAAVNGVVMLLPVGLLLVDRPASVVASAVLLTLLFCMELAMWWLPYATGRAIPALTQGEEPWSVVHRRLFRGDGDRPAPGPRPPDPQPGAHPSARFDRSCGGSDLDPRGGLSPGTRRSPRPERGTATLTS